ncbi:MAG: hypothetical protein AUI91_09745 [Acidobacteria bacterium 13_1_40CM_3_56_11]|nr:MAG: hypothetical protein AUI91_09745 [Acidobacteria bacterium 13_1_40CM_3_56_11]
MRFKAFATAIILFIPGRPAHAEAPVTFNNQVVRILQQHCQTCHRPGNIAPFSLLTYADTRPWARAIRDAVLLKKMPPWKPVGSHGVFEGERSLTEQEIQTISQWVNDGAEEGAASDLPEPLKFPQAWSAGTPDAVLQPPASYAVKTGSDDVYRCFPMAVDATSDLYVRGYEVLPGNSAIVHHVLLFIDEFNQSAALEGNDSGPGYTCFGGAGFLFGLGGLGGWVPGTSPQMFPLGTGVRIPKGARIVMQVHYSLVDFSRTSSASPDPDLTRVGIYTSPVPLEPITFLPIVNPLFSIPAGESHYQVKAVLPISRTVELTAIAPHMHLLGREATIEARFPNGDRRQLIRIDDWDFHWQGNYIYRDPIILPAGTILEMTAYYDNSLNNPKNPSNPPVTVRWGERTTDEMCLTFISVKSPGIPNINTLPFSMTDRGGNSLVTQGIGAEPQVGYARVTGSSGSAPSGLAIFSYRQNGVVVSEAGVPASKLMSQGILDAETNAAIRSGIAIANPNADAAVVSFSFSDESGQTISSGSTTVPANSQIARFLNDDPFNGPGSFSGTFSFTASKSVAVVALRMLQNERSDLIWTTLPVVDPATLAGPAIPAVFPHFVDGGGWSSQIMLINPGNSATSGTLRFADPAGQPISSLEYSIPPRGAQHFVTPGAGEAVRMGTVAIVPSPNMPRPSGLLIFSDTKSDIRVTEAGVPVSAVGTAFRVYVEASDATQSGIAIMNTTANPANVRIELMDLNGASLAATTIAVRANAQLAAFLTEIPGLQNLSLPIQGLLRITSASAIAVIGLRGRTNERGDFLITTTPPVAEDGSSSPELFFPHFADAGGFTTQFILFSNGSNGPLGGTIRFLSQSGQPLDVKVR